jgi:Xaa-Pro aminopeptidase
MLKSEPSAYRYAVEQAGMAASRRMQNTFDGAIREVQAERKRLAGIIGGGAGPGAATLVGSGSCRAGVPVWAWGRCAAVPGDPVGCQSGVASFIVGEDDR